jgi:hypothetical protein
MRAIPLIAAAGICWHGLLPAGAEVINARSLARADVERAVSSAREGDTVVVPAGKEDWTSTLNITKAITLQFAGIGKSVILDDIVSQKPNGNPGWSQAVINLSTQPNKHYRLTGLEIDKGLVRTNKYFRGDVQISGATTGFRVDHCGFFQLLNNGIYIGDAACGVIDHCVVNQQGGGHAVLVTHERWAGKTFGDGSWETPAGWGASNAVFIEDCIFTNGTTEAWRPVDSWAGARWVFRHNQVFNANLSAHGTESSGRFRGTRMCEIYLNQFQDANAWPDAITLRSSSAVVWSNIATGGYRAFCLLDNYRSTDSYKFWGPADGTNPLDNNEAGPVLVATHTGPDRSRTLVVSGANWKANQWAGYSVIDMNDHHEWNTANKSEYGPNLAVNVHEHQFGLIASNTATEAFLLGTAVHPVTVFNTGDTVKFYKVISAVDMPGMGQCGPLKRDGQGDPVAPGPKQQIEPVYSWGNTLNGADAGAVTRNAIMVEGVHYINDTPKPGYTPFTYPHPLTLLP